MDTISNVRIFDGRKFLNETAISFSDGKIVSTHCNRCGLDMQGMILAPGFVDIHMHGLLGNDAMHKGAIEAMAKAEPQFGTTSFCPASITATDENIKLYMERIHEARKMKRGARVLGAYLEGPFLAESTCGAHDKTLLCDPELVHYEHLVECYEEDVVRITIAPERPGGDELIRTLSDRGIVVSIGHSAASYEEAIHSFDLGIQSTTHTCNGMFPLHHRNPGVMCAILNDDRVKAEVIADLHHVHPQVIRMLYRSKGVDGIYFCTDSLEATGQPDGVYHTGNDPRPVVVKDGIATKDGGLAGSTLTMDKGLRNLVNVVGIPLEQALQMGTRNPADVLKRLDIGRIEQGASADFVLLNDGLEVCATYIRGNLEYRK